MYIDPTGHWEEGDDKLNGDAKAKIIALTNAWNAAKTQAEKDKIQQQAVDIRADKSSYVKKDTLVKITNETAFDNAMKAAMADGAITDKETKDALKIINAKVSTTSSTEAYIKRLTTLTVTTTTIGKADIKVSSTTVQSAKNTDKITAGVSIKICTNYSAYIIYDSTQTNLGWDKADMKAQALDQKTEYERLYGEGNVLVIGVDNANDFKEVWDSMGGQNGTDKVENATLVFHGSSRSMAIGGVNGVSYSRIRNDRIRNLAGDVAVNQLEQKNIEHLNLSSCNTGSLDVNDNMAVSFMRNQPGIKYATGWDGTAMYLSFTDSDTLALDKDNFGKKGAISYSRNSDGEIIATYRGGSGWPFWLNSEIEQKNFGK